MSVRELSLAKMDASLRLCRAANNGQQVAGHDDRPNIF